MQLKDYTTIRNHLQDYVARSGIKVWIGTEYTNYALYELITPVVCYNVFNEFIFVNIFSSDVYAAHVVHMTLLFETIAAVCVCVGFSPSHYLKPSRSFDNSKYVWM